MNSARHYFLTTIFFLAFQSIYAQGGCLFYNEQVFVIDIKLPETWSKSNDLQVLLVNEDSIPYTNEPVFINDTPETVKTPKQFELNTEKNAKQRKNPYQQRDYFETLNETWYTCSINKNQNEYARPIYQVMIISNQKKTADTIVVHLPYERSLDICRNNLDRTTTNISELVFNDGTPFTPITIDLNAEQIKPVVSNPLISVYFKYAYQTLTQNGNSLIQLLGINIYDKFTLAKVQYISIDTAALFKPNQWKQFTETADFYTDNPAGILDFRYTTEFVFDSLNYIIHHKFDHYVFNPLTNQFEKDDILSAAYNVRFEAKEIKRSEVVFTPEKKYYNTYLLNKNKWELTGSRTEQLQPKYAKLKYCLGWSETTALSKTALFFTDKSYYNYYYDTIPFINYCDDTSYASINKTLWPNQFGITDTIMPKSTGYLAVKLPITFNPSVIELIERYNSVIFNVDNVYPIQYTLFSIPPGTEERDSLTGNIVRYISQYDTNSFLIQVLELHKNGMPKGWGACSRKSRIKVMTWRYWDEEGNELPAIRYSKELMINILNSERLIENPKVSVKTNGIWIKPEIRKVSSTLIFYLPIETDSLIIISNDARVDIKLNKWQYENFAGLAYYLLLKDELYVDNNGIKIPITWEENDFVIHWDYEYLYSNLPTSRDINIAVARLQTKYPSIQFSMFGKYEHTINLHIPNLSTSAKKALLEQLIKEPEISKLAQVFILANNNRTFLQDDLSLSLDHWMNLDQINDLALKYNCKLNNIAFTGNLYRATFQDALLGPSFIKKLNHIATDPQVLGVNHSFYSEASLDDPYLRPQPDLLND